jgi:hypothetical protein
MHLTFRPDAVAQTTLDDVLLNDVVCGPEVVTLVSLPARNEQLRGLHSFRPLLREAQRYRMRCESQSLLSFERRSLHAFDPCADVRELLALADRRRDDFL